MVVGGVAATVHGSARYTNDLDLCHATDPENLRRLVELLTEWKACLRGVEPGLPFILDVRTFAITPLLTLTLDALISAKQAVRRKKDVEHLIELEALRALRATPPSST